MGVSIVVNELNCTTGKANLGAPACQLHLAIEGFIETPSKKELTAAEQSDIVATLQAGVKANLGANRYYPFPALTKGGQTGGDPNETEFDNGLKVYTTDTYIKYEFEFYNGGICISNALRKRSGQAIYGFFYGGGKLIGTTGPNGRLAAIPFSSFTAPPATFAFFKTPAIYKFSMSVLPKVVNENIKVAVLPGTFDPSTLNGLLDVNLSIDTALVAGTGVVKFRANESCNGDDYAALYPTELSTLGLWSAKNKLTGGLITVTAVSVAGSIITVTFDPTDPDYTAVPVGAQIVVSVGPISALETAGVLGVEVQSFTITK
jgi:hypothetical protein